MSILQICGGKPLCGRVRTQGSKNAALPIIAACCLCGCETELLNCPCLSDVSAAADILRQWGCSVAREDDVLGIDTRCLDRCDIPE